MAPSVHGRWVTATGSRAHLDFGEDGALSGSDGANRISTTWYEDEGGAIIDPFFTTLMAGPGMQPWVAQARRVTVEGGDLAVYDAAGNRLGEMIRDSGQAQ